MRIIVMMLILCATFSIAAPLGQPRASDSCVETSDFRRIEDPDDTGSIQRAVATGRCVHLVVAAGRELVVSHDILITKPDQLIYGDGRLTTRLRSGDPRGFSKGFFVAQTGEPGPRFRNFGVFYNQPDVSVPDLLIRYPPAFLLDATPRFHIDEVGCYLAIVCVSAKRNSGGAILRDVQMTAFAMGVNADDALDSMRFEDIQWYPFYLTPNLRSLFLTFTRSHAVGIKLGRVDDFHIVDSIFLGGLGVAIGPSTTDGTVGFGSVRGCDFDSGYGIEIAAVGSINIVGNEFTLGVENATSLSMIDGIASIVANKFLLAVSAAPITIGGGMATITANNFALGSIDATLLRASGAQTQVVFASNIVVSDGMHTHRFPLIDLQQGDLVATGNIVTKLLAPVKGTFISSKRGTATTSSNFAIGWTTSPGPAN